MSKGHDTNKNQTGQDKWANLHAVDLVLNPWRKNACHKHQGRETEVNLLVVRWTVKSCLYKKKKKKWVKVADP